MSSERDRVEDRDLERGLHGLADAFAADALPEDRVVDVLETRLHRRRTGLTLGAVGLAVAVVAGVGLGVRALSQPAVGGPAAMPELVGLFVTEQPSAGGRCYALRLYDSTPADGRVALWAWTAGSSCRERSSNLSTGIGTAGGVQLPSGPGIAVEATSGTAPELEGLWLFVDPTLAGDGSVQAFPSIQAPDTEAIRLRPVEEVSIPYRPG